MIMKTLKKIALAGVFVSLIACEKDFLETFPTNVLSQEQVNEAAEVNPSVGKGTLLGIYENLYRRGSGGTCRSGRASSRSRPCMRHGLPLQRLTLSGMPRSCLP